MKVVRQVPRQESESNEPKSDLVLMTIPSFIYLFPIQVTTAQVMDWSYRGTFPRAIRLINQKSEALFERDKVLEWAREKFATTHPKQFQIIERTLKSHPGCGLTRDHHTRLQPKFPIYNKKTGATRLESLPNAKDLVRTGNWTWEPQDAAQ